MKSTLCGDSMFSLPAFEIDNCTLCLRNQDFLTGYPADLFYHMQYIGHYNCLKGFYIERSMPSSILILLTLGGEGELIYKNEKRRLSAGSLMVINATNKHIYRTAGENWEFKYLHFWGAMSSEYQDYIERNSDFVLTPADDTKKRIEGLLDEIYNLTLSDTVGDYAYISQLIYTILTVLISGTVSLYSHNDKEGKYAIQRAISYIRQNYYKNIDTECVAKAALISRSYMSQLFRKHYGISPHRYIVELRLSIVKDALANTDAPVSKIAENTGFGDVSSLSRVFKRCTGISPTEYRKRYARVKESGN